MKINKKNVQTHIESKIDLLIGNLPDIDTDKSIRKLVNKLDWHLKYNFTPSYTREEFVIIELAFLNYWTSRISIDQLFTRIETIAGLDVDRVIDPCFYNSIDYDVYCA